MNKEKFFNFQAFIKQSSNLAPDLVVIACCLLSLGFSVIESRLNNDPHHWGLMYANATQLNQGLIPYKEIFIQYGFLTTWIQAVSLNFLGDTVVAVGVITGVFYAVNIYLSYCLWQKILNKWLSALSAFLMFLVHGYITYPWSNYISYTFLLLSLLFLVNSQQRKSYYLLSGAFFALNVLARQTSLVSTLVPIELYFVLTYLISENKFRKKWLINIAMFHLSIISIFLAFYLYLIKVDAWKDWYLQSVTIVDFYEAQFGGRYTILRKLLISLLLARNNVAFMPSKTDLRLIFYSLIFFNSLIIWGRLLFKIFRQKVNENIEIEKNLFLFSSITLFGVLQSAHIYEIFRLQSSSSIGIGLIIFSGTKISIYPGKYNRLILRISLAFLIVLLSKTLLFTRTSSVFHPWDKNLLFGGELQSVENIPILRGKLHQARVISYYQTLQQTLEAYSGKLDYLVSYSSNSYVLSLSKKFKHVQKSPFYDPGMSSLIFPQEDKVNRELFAQEKAIIVTSEYRKIPDNYCAVLELNSRKIAVIYTDSILYVAVPKAIAKDCKNIT